MVESTVGIFHLLHFRLTLPWFSFSFLGSTHSCVYTSRQYPDTQELLPPMAGVQDPGLAGLEKELGCSVCTEKTSRIIPFWRPVDVAHFEISYRSAPSFSTNLSPFSTACTLFAALVLKNGSPHKGPADIPPASLPASPVRPVALKFAAPVQMLRSLPCWIWSSWLTRTELDLQLRKRRLLHDTRMVTRSFPLRRWTKVRMMTKTVVRWRRFGSSV